MQQDLNWIEAVNVMGDAVNRGRQLLSISSKQMVIDHQYSPQIFIYIFRIGGMMHPMV